MPDPIPSPASPADPAAASPTPAAAASSTPSQSKGFDIEGALGAGYSPDEITAYLAQNPTLSPRFDVAGALKAGYSPAEITDHMAGTGGGALQGAPVIAPIMRGVAHAMSGVADLATDVGLPGVGSAIRGHIDQEDLAAPTSGAGLVADLKAGRLGAAAEALPSAVLEQAPTLIPSLAAGALTGGAADAPLVAAALRAGTAGVLSGATQGDAIARTRAANNGRVTPSTADLLAGVAGAAGIGSAGSAGLGGAGSGLTGALKGLATHATADAAQPELASLAGSLGTRAGPQNADASTMAATALTGAATRGALEASSAAAAAYTAISPAARAANLRAQFAAMSPDQQQSTQDTAAAGAALKAAQQPGATGTTLSAPDAARAAIARLSGGVNSLAGSLADQGVIGDDDKAIIGTALRAAASPGDVLSADHLDAIKALELDPAAHDSLTGALRTVDRLSQATRPQPAGPVQGALQEAAGPLGGALVGSVSGGPAGVLAGAVLGRAAKAALAPALGGIGAKLDGLLGLSKPSLVLDAQKAASMLQAAGQPIPDNRADLMSAIAGSQDAIATQRRILGLGPSPGQPQGSATAGASPPSGSYPAFDDMAATQAADAQSATPIMPGLGKVVEPLQGSASGTAPASVGGAPGDLPGARVGGFDPTAPGGLSGPAALHAARLPQWVYGLGASLENALQSSGQARPVNHAAEVGQALDDLTRSGLLEPDMAAALQGHQGRVTPLVYNLIRNALLTRNGVDRRTLEAQRAGPMSAGVVVPATDE